MYKKRNKKKKKNRTNVYITSIGYKRKVDFQSIRYIYR